MANADRAELEHWLAHRNADAFHAIVARHAGMVYNTCRRILRDVSDAEDVTQECFETLARTERLPRTTYLGAWLHGIATNRALERLRKDARREQREARYATEQPAAREPEWNEVYDLVDEALAELPDEFRDPIIAHYLEGQTHRAIAATLGIPRRTVTNHIARGLALLSEALRQRGVTIPSAILAALLVEHATALALPPALASTLGKLALAQGNAATTSAAMAASTSMAIGKALAAAIALCFVGAGIWWWSNDKAVQDDRLALAETTAPATFAAETQDANDSSTPASSPAHPQAASEAQAPPETGDHLLLCEVVQHDLTPVPGALVTLTTDTAVSVEDFQPRPRIERHGRTDAQGEVVFNDLPERGYIIVAETPGEIAFAQSAPHYFSRARVVLKPAATFSGVVRDNAGQPVAGAEIFYVDCQPHDDFIPEFAQYLRAGTTNTNGSFAVNYLRGYTLQLQIRSETHPPLTTPFLSAEISAELTVDPGITLDGSAISDDTGDPVSGATVVLRSTTNLLDRHIAATDDTGRFTVSNLQQDTYAVHMRHDTLAPIDLENTVTIGPEPAAPLHIAMNKGGTISGVVTDSKSGEGLADVNAGISMRVGEIVFSIMRKRTDSTGEYEFSALPPGTYQISLEDPEGYERMNGNRSHEVQLAPNEQHPGTDFALASTIPNPAAVVSGRVVDDNGRSVPRAVVSTNVLADGMRYVEARTNAAGEFQLHMPPSRDACFQAFALNMASEQTAPITITPEGLHGLTLVLHPAGSISGQIVTTSGRPFKLLDVRLSDGLPLWHYVGVSTVEENGYFRISDLPAGKHPLTLDFSAAVVPGSGMRRGDRTITSGFQMPNAVVPVAVGEQVKGIEITVDVDAYMSHKLSRNDPNTRTQQQRELEDRKRREWKIEGRVLDANHGGPVVDYQLTAANTTYSDSSHEHGHFELTVDPYLPDMADKPAVLEINAPGYSPLKYEVSKSQAVAGTAHVTIKLQPSPIVDGIVVNAEGSPVAGASIWVGSPPEMLASSATVTDANGAFHLDSVELKTQTVYADCPGYALGFAEITPSASGVTEARIVLTQGGRIEGTVTAAGNPAPGAQVGYDPDGFGRKRYWITTGADGRFSFECIKPGRSYLMAVPPGVDLMSFDTRHSVYAVVQEGETTIVTIDFPAATSHVEGLISFRGEPCIEAQASAEMLTPNGQQSVNIDLQGGYYQTGPIPAGTLKLVIHNATANGTIVRNIEIAENESFTHDIEIGTGAVSGTVTGIAHDVYHLIAVVPSGVSEPDVWSSQAVAFTQAADGQYAIEGLDPDSYAVWIIRGHSAEETRIRAAEFNVTDGQSQSLNLDLR